LENTPRAAAAAAVAINPRAAVAAAAAIGLKFHPKHVTNKNKTKHIMKISHINVNNLSSNNTKLCTMVVASTGFSKSLVTIYNDVSLFHPLIFVFIQHFLQIAHARICGRDRLLGALHNIVYIRKNRR
jgi:hypothetical protein